MFDAETSIMKGQTVADTANCSWGNLKTLDSWCQKKLSPAKNDGAQLVN